MGVIGVLIAILLPVGLLIVISSKYPTMIERRMEARDREQATSVMPRQSQTTIEIIKPDGTQMDNVYMQRN
ncbi:hypothetical protein ALQ04_01822 [Pseudomonas cichorii]|uniref:Uncharacterized protein n=1 Tax=Pseudomonas cichorii TaxID=36746 RepID=A0A3M4MAN1_PSECI|nr:hypothetical protein [Pseudomonas cichorii]RMQ50870.1 hypothetical protein ALQ04_01822 [Pseudomonas cichorii]